VTARPLIHFYFIFIPTKPPPPRLFILDVPYAWGLVDKALSEQRRLVAEGGVAQFGVNPKP